METGANEPRPASTVLLVRPSIDGLEVFLVRRHDAVAFMGGAHVFPGGRVDAGDRTPSVLERCDGIDRMAARIADVGRDDAAAFAVAAARELFEEAGILLARDASGATLAIDTSNRTRFDAYRHALAERSIAVGEVLHQESLRLALDALEYCAHWVTPALEARRFDTRFFLALAPSSQEAAHDQRETTHGAWFAPSDAIARAMAGDIALPPPTWTMLRTLSAFDSAAAAMTWARTCPVPRILPVACIDGDRRIIGLPGDPMCAPVDGFVPSHTRFLLVNGRWSPVPYIP